MKKAVAEVLGVMKEILLGFVTVIAGLLFCAAWGYGFIKLTHLISPYTEGYGLTFWLACVVLIPLFVMPFAIALIYVYRSDQDNYEQRYLYLRRLNRAEARKERR